MRLYFSVRNLVRLSQIFERKENREGEREREEDRGTNGNKFSVRSKQFRNANILSFILCIMRITRGIINQYFDENAFRIN